MAVYRYVHSSFWEDSKVLDVMTPEDRYFMLYLLTNPHTNQLGCYEISTRQIVNETGYNSDTIEKLINRFETILKVIKYSNENKEMLILNWYKYNWTTSPKVQTMITKQTQAIKTKEFIEYIDRVCIPYVYPFAKEIKRKEIKTNKITEINIYEIVESNFGRTLSPIEYESIEKWLSDYPAVLIQRAIEEAINSNNKAIKYIDRILFNWKSQGLKTIAEVEEYSLKYRKAKEEGGTPYGTILN